MKVYAVIEWVRYEGESLVEIFSSKEEADKFVKKERGNYSGDLVIHEIEVKSSNEQS